MFETIKFKGTHMMNSISGELFSAILSNKLGNGNIVENRIINNIFQNFPFASSQQ